MKRSLLMSREEIAREEDKQKFAEDVKWLKANFRWWHVPAVIIGVVVVFSMFVLIFSL